MTTIGRRVTLLFVGGCFLAAAAAGADFDRTIPVATGQRLDLRLFGGTITVHAWGRSDLHVRATHFRTDEIDVRASGQVIQVRAHARAGAPHAIDVDLDVPAWMAVTIAGTYIDVSVAGTRAPVTVETVRGDIAVRGGAGALTLKAIEGDVVVEGGQGHAEITAVNNGVRVTAFSGDVFAQTVNGNVTLEGLQSTSVEVGTFGGDIRWDGPLAARGRYQLTTHYGDIDVALRERANATVSVRSFVGRFRSMAGVTVPDDSARRGRFSFVLGTGNAQLNLETFRGTISLRRYTPPLHPSAH